MALYAVFGIGVGNLGRGRTPRRPMSKWVQLLNRHLPQRHPLIRITGYFGHTGNFLADSDSIDLEEVTARFGKLLGTAWVVPPIDDVCTALTGLADVPEPLAENGIRWTLGLAFHGGVGIACGSVATTPQGVLWRIAPHTIGVRKRDVLGGDDTLNRNRRGGGWGKVSADIESQLGGQWTARSGRTIMGLIRKEQAAKTV